MVSRRILGCAVFLLFGFVQAPRVSVAQQRGAQQASGASLPIASRIATVDGVKLHYLMAGHGPAVVLLHGYAETSRMWRPLMRTLATRFTVIASDRPGIGDSDIPSDGLDTGLPEAARHASLGQESD